MKAYILTTPKDVHGQPLRMFKANLENSVSKAIDQLSGICAGILADGIVTEQEATFFGEWVHKSEQMALPILKKDSVSRSAAFPTAASLRFS